METIRPDFVKSVAPGDIIVAGKNFGCGSSREHAPLAIKGCGVAAVIAKSFAGIFFRNAINIGLPFLEVGDISSFAQGDEVEIDLHTGMIKNCTKHKEFSTRPFPAFLEEIVKQGGLMSYIKNKKRG
jgi:3-isopropylmalate/(R)-2-methylmalate dehydratase small subunit